MDDYRAVMELNVFAVLLAMQKTIPIMRKQGGGMILNISSLVSKNYFPTLAAYASTKYALNALSLTAREELQKDNIVVSVFHPKMTATEFGAQCAGRKIFIESRTPGHGRGYCRSRRQPDHRADRVRRSRSADVRAALTSAAGNARTSPDHE